jgi:predicted kinase
MNKPTLTVLVGLPGAGKSTWINNHKEKLNMVVHSSDEIRTELLGDVNDQSKNDLVFQTLHSRVKEDLLNGNNVVYDATNLSRKRRISFIQELKHISCKKVCVLFATPYQICLANNFSRERQVPEGVISRMIKSFDVPAYCEEWDDIQIIWWNYSDMVGFEYDLFSDLLKWSKISHDSPYHTLSIGDHMFNAYNHYMKSVDYMDRNNILANAILLHDCGKPDVKSYHDSKGNPTDGVAHFYSHENVSSYLSLFYLNEIGYTDEEILYGSLLIGLHMKPLLSWNQSDKAKEKDRRLYGDDIISAIEVISTCDRAAH